MGVSPTVRYKKQRREYENLPCEHYFIFACTYTAPPYIGVSSFKTFGWALAKATRDCKAIPLN